MDGTYTKNNKFEKECPRKKERKKTAEPGGETCDKKRKGWELNGKKLSYTAKELKGRYGWHQDSDNGLIPKQEPQKPKGEGG